MPSNLPLQPDRATRGRIERCTTAAQPGWADMRAALWPHSSRTEHLAEMQALLAEPERFVAFIAQGERGDPAGFAEASIRRDYVNGTVSSPVAFLEGIYVTPHQRGHGIARALVQAVAQWATTHACTELASDVALDNDRSQEMHKALGFYETERVVYFCKRLTSDREAGAS